MNKIACIIPARLNSFRFPKKALADILGKPLIQHVYERASLSPLVRDNVYVATCDQEIINVVKSFGGKALKTSPDHPRPTSRVFEAAKMLNADLVVDVQGDEPLVNPQMIDSAIGAYKKSDGAVGVSLMERCGYEDALDKNKVKVVFDRDFNALFFSREPIPSKWLGDKKFPFYFVVAVFVYPLQSLELFNRLKMTQLENIESVDLLRFVENGYKIKMVETPYLSCSIDVFDDIKTAEGLMRKEALFINQ